jgi:hypothetical protein
VYGNIVKELSHLGLWKKQPGEITLSACELYVVIENLSIGFYYHEEDSARAHKKCRLVLSAQALEVLLDVPELVQDCHVRHMERRAAQLATLD